MNSALSKPVNRCKLLVGLLIVLGPALFFVQKYAGASKQVHVGNATPQPVPFIKSDKYGYACNHDSDAINNETHSCDMMVMRDEVQTKGYVITLKVLEQTESALYGLYQILSLFSPWRMQLVEPFITGGSFGMKKELKKDQLRFSDIFNLSRVNQQLGHCLGVDYSPIISFERYMTQTLSTVKVVTFVHQEVNDEDCLGQARESIVSDIPNVGKDLISEAFCVKEGGKMNFTELLQSVLGMDQTKLAVVIPSWKGVRPYPVSFFHIDPEYKERDCALYNFESSNALVLEAERFIGANLKRPYLGIHLRIERLDNDKAYDTDKCVEKMIKNAGIIKDKYNLGPDNIVAFTDYGKYGSMTCHNCPNAAERLQVTKRLARMGIRVMEYEPSRPKYGHTAFISTVEREVLTSSEYLLVSGYGAFQTTVTHRFLRRHTPERLYSVCSELHYK